MIASLYERYELAAELRDQYAAAGDRNGESCSTASAWRPTMKVGRLGSTPAAPVQLALSERAPGPLGRRPGTSAPSDLSPFWGLPAVPVVFEGL